jgi:anti-sigma regulatory factor (Ser/Thr protein kinase)
MIERKAQGNDFRHEAFFYAGAEEFLAGTLPFLRAGLEAEDAILVALPSSRLELLKGELRSEAEGIRFVRMEELGRNPARIIPACRDFLAANLTPERGVRGIGEPVWEGRSAAELDECERHEALLNLAFGGGPAWPLMCPYDSDALGDEVLRSAEHSHPVLSRDGALGESTSYIDPSSNGDPFTGHLPAPTVAPGEFLFTIEELAAVRRFVAQQAGREGLSASRIGDLVLAANELATNSLRHGGGKGTMRIWREGGCLVCEVSDDGRIDKPLVGRERPRPDQAGGRGIWLANQLCDLVQIRSGEAGNVVRLQMSVEA